MIQFIPVFVTLWCIYTGLKALHIGSGFNRDYFYYKERRCLFGAVAFSTTASCVFLLLSIKSLSVMGGFDLNWLLYHTGNALGILAFHHYVLLVVRGWQKAVQIHGGVDFRKT
jgi:hypothetical protein